MDVLEFFCNSNSITSQLWKALRHFFVASLRDSTDAPSMIKLISQSTNDLCTDVLTLIVKIVNVSHNRFE